MIAFGTMHAGRSVGSHGLSRLGGAAARALYILDATHGTAHRPPHPAPETRDAPTPLDPTPTRPHYSMRTPSVPISPGTPILLRTHALVRLLTR